MALHYSLADSQAKARARVFLAGMKSLEQHEKSVPVFGRDPYAVVANRTHNIHSVDSRRYMHARPSLSSEPHRIIDEVLEYLGQLPDVAIGSWQRIVRDIGAGVTHCHPKVTEGLFQRFLQSYFLEGFAPGTHTRICQQIVDQPLHPQRTVRGIVDEIVGIGIELSPVSRLEQLNITGDHAQRLLEVV